jgi:hypothetical protein
MSDDQNGGSVFDELGNMGQAAWNAASAAGDAVIQTETAALDAATGFGAMTAGGLTNMAAGAAYAVQADDTAASLRASADGMIDDAQRYYGDAGRDLGNAGADLWGSNTDAAGDPNGSIE